MANLYLPCFFNSDRPSLNQPSVTELPHDVLDATQCQELERSLQVYPSDYSSCSASARLWESLIETHRIPYLLVRVADMRMCLGSRATALDLYEEIQKQLNDPALGRWLASLRSQIDNELTSQLHNYKTLIHFTPSQRWRSTTQLRFPYCKLQSANVNSLRALWRGIGPPDEVLAQFLRVHCLETNAVEGAVKIDASASTRLIQLGFYDQVEPLRQEDIIGGQIRDPREALHLLQDTHKAIETVLELISSEPITITPKFICDLHKTLTRSSHILYLNDGVTPRFSYTNAGVTRQKTGVNITITSSTMKIQFAPYDEVDTELAMFCKHFNELLRKQDADPFAAAAWISDLLSSIHPFEDGNGRLSRILASIPLLKRDLPPLCISLAYKQAYLTLMNAVRANRDGDYSLLMQGLYNSTKSSVQILSDTTRIYDALGIIE